MGARSETKKHLRGKHKSQDAGFSMLEAVIAIGILGACLLPLLEFQISVSDGASRLTGRQSVIEIRTRAETYLRALPPASLAQGEADLGDARLVWREIQRAPDLRGLSEQGAPGRFEVTVVRLSYEVRRPGSSVVSGAVDRLAWTAVTPYFDR
jgi:general secretion pathway protein I